MDFLLDCIAMLSFPLALSLMIFITPGLLVCWDWDRESVTFKSLMLFTKIAAVIVIICFILISFSGCGLWDGRIFC
ncbi:hypothetical protein DWY25_04395 [Holdemania filiformis]|uniref:Uncharacterized protein n=1 Tax=Holdemania filiformis TaxID=61171 RepID=A0A412G4I8_9FIRM|nr:hypothetical protein DWY25_04395 [Holdemania filiformis]